MLGSNSRTERRRGLSALLGMLSLKRRARKAGRGAHRGSTGWAQTSWGRKLIKTTTLVLAVVCAASVALADTKITTRSGTGGQTMTTTTYLKGTRLRTEAQGYTTIYQCDLKRMIQINDKTRTYLIMPTEGGTNAASQQKSAAGAKRGGVITYTTTVTDTGERKDILGLKAKHMKLKVLVTASEGACNTMNMEMNIDGWYTDLPAGASCTTQGAPTLPSDDADCVDEVRYKMEGVANPGYPLTTTMQINFNTGDGSSIPPTTTTQEVTDVSNAALDQSLFEIPQGYKEVKSSRELGY